MGERAVRVATDGLYPLMNGCEMGDCECGSPPAAQHWKDERHERGGRLWDRGCNAERPAMWNAERCAASGASTWTHTNHCVLYFSTISFSSFVFRVRRTAKRKSCQRKLGPPIFWVQHISGATTAVCVQSAKLQFECPSFDLPSWFGPRRHTKYSG